MGGSLSHLRTQCVFFVASNTHCPGCCPPPGTEQGWSKKRRGRRSEKGGAQVSPPAPQPFPCLGLNAGPLFSYRFSERLKHDHGWGPLPGVRQNCSMQAAQAFRMAKGKRLISRKAIYQQLVTCGAETPAALVPGPCCGANGISRGKPRCEQHSHRQQDG